MIGRISKNQTQRVVAPNSVSTFSFCLLLASLLVPQLSHAESYPFGRLFTNDSERRALDRLRRNSDSAPEVLITELVEPDQESRIQVAPTKVKFSGYVRRSDGKYAIWLDGKSDLSAANTGAISVILAPDQSSAIFSSPNADATLMPGQIWYPEQGIVKDHYQIDKGLTFEDTANALTTPIPTPINSENLLKTNSEIEPKSVDKPTQEILIKQAIEALSKAATQINTDPAKN